MNSIQIKVWLLRGVVMLPVLYFLYIEEWFLIVKLLVLALVVYQVKTVITPKFLKDVVN